LPKSQKILIKFKHTVITGPTFLVSVLLVSACAAHLKHGDIDFDDIAITECSWVSTDCSHRRPAVQ